MATFAERLKHLRLEKGLTQKKFAEIIGTNTRNLQYYESGDRNPSFETFLAILEEFDISADYFLGRTQNKYSHKENSTSKNETGQTDQILSEILLEHTHIKNKIIELDNKISLLKD